MSDSDEEIGAGAAAGGRPDETLEDQHEDNANRGHGGDEQAMESKPVIIPPKPESPEEEKQYIKELEAKANLTGIQLGQTWYVVASKWWKAWKDYTSFDWYSSSTMGAKVPPGPINNDPILEPGAEEGKIRKTCMENYDFMIISEEMWLTLHAWYGGGPALPRSVISSGWHSSNLAVEVRPLTLKVIKSSAMQDQVSVTVSKSETVGGFKTKMCEKMGLKPEDVRVWDYHAFNKYKLLDDMKQKLDAAQIIDGQPMLLEEKDENGKFPEIPKAKSVHSSYSSYHSSGGPTDPGTTGLINLGNTCFMNSSLQCLSNTAPLTEFFLAERYKADLNRDNPLGMKGEVADEYAELIKEIWSGNHSAVAPREFKWKLERFAPQFAGYQQHDSQELLAFLLDGLHEDLNRVRSKPYKENPEVDDRPQEIVAKEAWENHKARNNSIIVDWFQGQLRSTLVCPVCSRVSITFDPFMYLSLPLPMKTTRVINLTFFFMDPSKKPIKFGCEVPKFGTVKDIQKFLEESTGVKADSIVVVDVYNCRFFKNFMAGEPVDNIQERDVICAYETLVSELKESDIGYFPVMHRKEESVSSHHYYSGGNYVRKSLFGWPLILSVPNVSKITYKQLYDLVYTQIQRYLKLPSGKIIRSTADLLDEEDKKTLEGESSDEEPAPQPRDVADGDDDSSDSSTEEDKPQPMQIKKKRKVQPLFTIKCVDNYGVNDQEALPDNDKPLNLDERQPLAICWSAEMAEQYYDEVAAKQFDLHESYNRPQEREMEDSVGLDKCIDLFTTTEKLGPDDPWYCNKCKEFQQATKKFDLWSLPPILVIHLKRFSYKNRYWREKLETLVNYPLKGLDMSPYVKGPDAADCVYDLYAVSNHYGSLGGGHYTAYAKNRLNNEWYKFDDSSVSKVDESRVVTSSAYVLFYRRRDTAPAPSAGPTLGSTPANRDEEDEVKDMETSSTSQAQEPTEQEMEEVQLD